MKESDFPANMVENPKRAILPNHYLSGGRGTTWKVNGPLQLDLRQKEVANPRTCFEILNTHVKKHNCS